MNPKDLSAERRARLKKVFERAKGIVQLGWTQGAAARDLKGRAISYTEPQAVSWCASGAIGLAWREFLKQEDLPSEETVFFAYHFPGPAWLLNEEVIHDNISRFNDEPGTTREAVIEKFDEMIAILSKGGK